MSTNRKIFCHIFLFVFYIYVRSKYASMYTQRLDIFLSTYIFSFLLKLRLSMLFIHVYRCVVLGCCNIPKDMINISDVCVRKDFGLSGAIMLFGEL